MLNFENDYSEGASELILQRLIETNDEKLPPYGSDPYCARAKEKIKAACRCPKAEVFFLSGGTQTNAVVIDALLQKHEGVVAATSGHINVHEAGTIENSGHKVLALPGTDGKLSSERLKRYIDDFYADANHEHSVFPGMVYISHPTEYGTLYSKRELFSLHEVCSEYRIPLYMDGARLGYGLMSESTDVSLSDIAEYCDVFYIGGTKVGALCGEAVVFTKENAPVHFMTLVKQHGALLAKGRLLGVQFDALFTDELYFKLSRNAIEKAATLKAALREKGYSFYIESPTNQVFITLENGRMRELEKELKFSFWEKADEAHTVVRLATSWATRAEEVEKLIAIL